jgi:transcriptional regulator of met regulon
MDEMASDADLRKEIKTHVTTEAKSVMKRWR